MNDTKIVHKETTMKKIYLNQQFNDKICLKQIIQKINKSCDL